MRGGPGFTPRGSFSSVHQNLILPQFVTPIKEQEACLLQVKDALKRLVLEYGFAETISFGYYTTKTDTDGARYQSVQGRLVNCTGAEQFIWIDSPYTIQVQMGRSVRKRGIIFGGSFQYTFTGAGVDMESTCRAAVERLIRDARPPSLAGQ